MIMNRMFLFVNKCFVSHALVKFFIVTKALSLNTKGFVQVYSLFSIFWTINQHIEHITRRHQTYRQKHARH